MTLRGHFTAAAVALAACFPLLADAQSTTRPGGSTATGTRPMTASTANSYSLLPGTTRGYIAASAGRPEFDAGCFFSCEDPDIGFKVVTGGAWSEVVGLEVGYLYFGTGDRNGGETEAHGVNLSVVGNLPIGEMFNLFAKLGTTYSFTDTTAAPGFRTGDERGFGLSYGAGVGLDLTRNWTVQAEWEQHRVKFISGRDEVSMVSLGVKYRF